MLGFWQTNSGKLSLFTMLPSEDAGRSGALQMFPEPMRRAPPVKKTRYIKISRNVRVHVCPDYSGCQKKNYVASLKLGHPVIPPKKKWSKMIKLQLKSHDSSVNFGALFLEPKKAAETPKTAAARRPVLLVVAPKVCVVQGRGREAENGSQQPGTCTRYG